MIRRVGRRLRRLLPLSAKRLILRMLVRIIARGVSPLAARLDRIEQNFAAELSRSRCAEASTEYAQSVAIQNVQEHVASVVERRYGVLGDRIRLLQQQLDLERVSSEELRRTYFAGAPQLHSIATDVGIINARLRATPFMTGPVFPAPSSAARDSDEFDYVGFENVFRGSEEMIQERQRPYLQFVEAGQRVVDLGCGRGEFLALATAAKAQVVGVDVSEAMVARCRKRGFTVQNEDALEYLRRLEPGSVDVIFSAQFVEHLDPDALYDLFRLSRRALVPEGTFIAETVNPHSLEALRTFYVDLTHVKPLFPEVLAFFARSAGFDGGRVFYPNGAGFDEESPWDYGEYAIIATTRQAATEHEMPASPLPLPPSHPPLG